MERLKRARALLERRGQHDLAELLKPCQLDITDSFVDGPHAAIRAPVDAYEQLHTLKSPAYLALLNTLREVRAKGELDFSDLTVELETQSLVGGALSDTALSPSRSLGKGFSQTSARELQSVHRNSEA